MKITLTTICNTAAESRASHVLGMTDLLLDTKLTSEQIEYAKTVKSSGNSLLQGDPGRLRQIIRNGDELTSASRRTDLAKAA